MRLQRALRAVLAGGTMVVLGACTTHSSAAPTSIRRSDTRIVTDELRAGTQANLYDFIAAARPAWAWRQSPAR